MFNDLLKNTNPFIKFLSFVIIIFTIIVSKTLPSIIVITLLSIILILINNKSVKEYVNFLKHIIVILILLTIIYIIVIEYGNVVLFTYKALLLFNVFKIYFDNNKFSDLDYSINMLFKPLEIFKINIDKISYTIVLNIYFIKCYISSKDEAKFRGFNLKRIIERIVYADEKVKRLDISLKLKFYRLFKYKVTIKDVIIILVFISVFIAAILKEVIA